MGLPATDLARLSTLLDEAEEVEPTERECWLASLQGESARLAPALRDLLARQASMETDDLLERPPAFAAVAAGPAAGDAVGPYRLLSELGSGGMGAVWLAERADGSLKRKVALKLPHLTWAPGLAERFAREREILASLEHPHIARLYDAGLDVKGRPFMALEYVEGQPLDVYCREHASSIPARLRLLLQVAEAVAFAHSRLVLHRDLKPANILVTAGGEVRLLDFGVAKLMQGDSTAETALTQASGRALTLDYASPEQICGEAIGTASDVYSLGVLAFELLAGVRPYRLKRGSVAELEEAITGQDVPLASAVSQEASTVKALRGDLDAILNKALKKSPTERYTTVDALAQDWRRHLEGAHVLARRDSMGYRVRRLVTRHRVPLAAAGLATAAFVLALGFGAATLVVTALLVGVGAALWQARAAARQRDHALTLLSRTEGVVEFLNLLITEAAESRRPVTVNNLLARSEALAMTAFRHAPEQQALVLSILGSQYQHLEEKEKAEALFKRAVDAARDSDDASFKARLECEHAVSVGVLRRLDEARTRLLEIADRTDIDSGTAALCLHYLSFIAIQHRDGPTAVSYARQALEKLKSTPRASLVTEASSMTHLASGLALCGRIREADQVFETVLARYAKLGREASPVTTLIRNDRAVIHSNSGDPRAALAIYDENAALIAERGDGGPSTTPLHNRAVALHAKGLVDAAIESYILALAAAERAGDRYGVRATLGCLSNAALDNGRIEDAQILLKRAEDVGAGMSQAEAPERWRLHLIRGRLALATGQFGQAREEFTAVIDGRRPTNITLIALSRRAELGLLEGDLNAALRDAEDAIELGIKLQGGKHYSWRTGDASLWHGRILEAQGERGQARAAYETALAHFSSTVDPSHPALRQLRQLLADAK